MLLDYFSNLAIWHFYVSGFPFKLVFYVRYDRKYEGSEVVVILIITYGFLKHWPTILMS
jgi:hypothetical protein